MQDGFAEMLNEGAGHHRRTPGSRQLVFQPSLFISPEASCII
jgi:hypothetical protein